jgi:hypothetical protein
MTTKTTSTTGGEKIFATTTSSEVDKLYKHAQKIEEAGADASKVLFALRKLTK